MLTVSSTTRLADVNLELRMLLSHSIVGNIDIWAIRACACEIMKHDQGSLTVQQAHICEETGPQNTIVETTSKAHRQLFVHNCRIEALLALVVTGCFGC